MGGSCTIAAGDTVQVYFTADAPSSTGSFYFTRHALPASALATSNVVTVGTSAETLTASTYAYRPERHLHDQRHNGGLGDLGQQHRRPHRHQSSGGSEALSFYDGTSGYTVTLIAPGGSAISDPVGAAVTSGNSVTPDADGPACRR